MTWRQTTKTSTITVTTEQQRISLTNMFTLHYKLLWYKWCCLFGKLPQRCGRKVDRTLCLCIYGKECRIDRTLYSTLLNSTHFFSVVDRTPTHYFWSTGWEVISKSPSHYSMASHCTWGSVYFSNFVQAEGKVKPGTEYFYCHVSTNNNNT